MHVAALLGMMFLDTIYSIIGNLLSDSVSREDFDFLIST